MILVLDFGFGVLDLGFWIWGFGFGVLTWGFDLGFWILGFDLSASAAVTSPTTAKKLAEDIAGWPCVVDRSRISRPLLRGGWGVGHDG